ncbi:MAG: type II secretion system F family protein [Planctomycetaceae bacterium]
MSPINQLIVVLVAVGAIGLLCMRLWRQFRPSLRLQKAVRRRRRKPAVAKPQVTVVAAPAAVAVVAPSTLNLRSSTRVDNPSTIPARHDQPSLPTLEAEDTPLVDDNDLAFGPITKLLAALLPESDDRRVALKKSLRNAGYYEPHAWHNLAAARYLGLILPIVIGLGLLIISPPAAEPWIFVGLVLLPALGWSLPTLLVRRQAADRLAEIERSMPDLLDMMNMCVSQGMTVPSSLQRVGMDLEAVSPALSQELKIVSDQARIGSLEQALVAFSKRVELPDVYSFTSLLVQTERMGTSMSQALAEYSDGMRETLRQQADQKANTASFKLLFPTVLCLMPAVFMILLGPAIIEMSAFFREGGNEVLSTSMESAQNVLQ